MSSNEVWGGSEELWSLAATTLARQGHAISVFKARLDRAEERLRTLAALGCPLVDLGGPSGLPRKLKTAFSLHHGTRLRVAEYMLGAGFRARRPDLVVVSQGLNHDGWYAADVCRRLGIAYVLLSHKADDTYWPHDSILDALRRVYADAGAAFFVSEHTRKLTEEQLGFKLRDTPIVRNPFRAEWAMRDDWPDDTSGWRFACLARLDTREKGQDLLLRVLASPKWRDRPISVRFFGSGQNRAGLEGMARFLGLDNVEFGGFVEQPNLIWSDVHGLILPSRCEGLPLSQVEAMLNARLVILTDAGGNGEAIADGETGFLADAATARHLDQAMERAWARRSEWRAIAAAGARHIRALVPADPAGSFAERLLALV